MPVTPRIEVIETDGARVVTFKDRMVFDDRTVREVGEQSRLASVMLHHRLDQERGLRQRIEVGDDPHPLGIDVRAGQLRAGPRERTPTASARRS